VRPGLRLLDIAIVVGVLLVAFVPAMRGRILRDLVGPALVAVALARFDPGWRPDASFRRSCLVWMRFVALVAGASLVAVSLFTVALAVHRGTVPWAFSLAVLRFVFLAVAGGLLLGFVARLAARLA
jgi:hypothetical protein